MAVAYQTQKVNQQPAGLELFDLSVPEKPRSISFMDCSGVNSRGVHQLWFCDGEYVHMARIWDYDPEHPNDGRILTDDVKLFEQLRDTLPVDNRPAEKGLFEKVKDYFV